MKHQPLATLSNITQQILLKKKAVITSCTAINTDQGKWFNYLTSNLASELQQCHQFMILDHLIHDKWIAKIMQNTWRTLKDNGDNFWTKAEYVLIITSVSYPHLIQT